MIDAKGMYTVSVRASFCATHRVKFPDGRWEPLHGHDWRVCACFAAPALDDLDMVVDFVAARHALEQIVAGFDHVCLNDHPWFEGRIPTAERVAECVFRALWESGFSAVQRVTVTEAPGCEATFESASPSTL